MHSSSAPDQTLDVWRARARPCFGTFLSIKLRGLSDEVAATLFADLFTHAERLHALMSRQDAGSELSAIARLAPEGVLQVSPDTAAVLRLALRVAEETGGAFDPVVPDSAGSNWRDVILQTGGLVTVRRPLKISLDGIAKGYAADRLCAAAIEHGATDVIIDAGGDLALHCRESQDIGLRDPNAPGRIVRTIQLARGGVASSGNYGGISELWIGRQPAKRWPVAISIVAPDCAVADALTKAVAARPELAADLSRWQAHAFVFDLKKGR